MEEIGRWKEREVMGSGERRRRRSGRGSGARYLKVSTSFSPPTMGGVQQFATMDL